MKILLSLPDELLKRTDIYCQRFNFNRSEFIRNLIRQKLFTEPEVKPRVEELKEKIRNIIPDDF